MKKLDCYLMEYAEFSLGEHIAQLESTLCTRFRNLPSK